MVRSIGRHLVYSPIFIMALLALFGMVLVASTGSKPSSHAPAPLVRQGDGSSTVAIEAPAPFSTHTTGGVGAVETIRTPQSTTSSAEPQQHYAPPAPSTPFVQTPNMSLAQCLSPDQWNTCLMLGLQAYMLSAITNTTAQFNDSLYNQEWSFVFFTPTELIYGKNADAVTTISSWCLFVTYAGLAVIIAWGGMNIMLKTSTGGQYSDARELLSRVVMAAIAALMVRYALRLFVDFTNLFSSGAIMTVLQYRLVPGATSSNGIIASIVNHMAAGSSAAGGGVGSILLVIAIIMLLLLAMQTLMLLAMKVILIAFAPLAVGLLWVLPRTRTYTKLWTLLIGGALFMQPMQTLMVCIGASFTTANWDATNLPIGNWMMGIATLICASMLPTLTWRWLFFAFQPIRDFEGLGRARNLWTSWTGRGIWAPLR